MMLNLELLLRNIYINSNEKLITNFRESNERNLIKYRILMENV